MAESSIALAGDIPVIIDFIIYAFQVQDLN